MSLADVQGTDLLDRRAMAMIGRSVALRGEAVFLIEDRGLVPCVDWDLSTRNGQPRAYRLTEGQALGLIPSDLLKDETPEQEAETRQLVVKTLWQLVQNGSEQKVRSDAWRMLKEMGEVK